MASAPQNIAIDRIGDLASWGTHIALFYETKDDLLDTVVPYCKTGLERKQSCVWFVAQPYLTAEEARQALGDAVGSLDRYQADGRIRIEPANDWFVRGVRLLTATRCQPLGMRSWRAFRPKAMWA